ncbi:MAG: hypothetical protein KDD62_03245, partial [Bdellovibrionales bacterium]|nr:hypothetical protein [Bdellovibrionales bacterium]
NALMVLEQLDSRELFLHPQYLSAASLYISNNLNMGCFLLQAIRAFPRADDNILEFHPSAQEYLPNPALAKSTLLYVLDCLEQEKGRTIQYVRAAVEFVRICGQADFLQSDIFQERAQAILEQWVCEPSAMSVTYKDSDNYLALYELVPAELQARLPNPIEEGNKFLISLNKNAEQQGRHYSKIITESEWNRHVDFAMTDFMSGKLLSFEQRILTMSQAIKQVNFSQNGLHDRWLEFQTICFMPLSPEDRASELVNLFLSINHTTDKGESELIGYQGMCVPYSCALIPIFDSLSEAKEELGLEEEAAALQAIVQAIMDYHDTSIPDEGIFQALRASYDAPGVAEILGLSRAELGDWTMGI